MARFYGSILDAVNWAFEHSVDCRTPVELAWNFWTDVRNWALDSDVVSVEMEGPFAAGASGITNSKSSGAIRWHIREAHFGHAVIEIPMRDAVARFDWAFMPTPSGCRITQRCTIEGERAGFYAEQFGPSLAAGIPAGMQKICEAIESRLSY